MESTIVRSWYPTTIRFFFNTDGRILGYALVPVKEDRYTHSIGKIDCAGTVDIKNIRALVITILTASMNKKLSYYKIDSSAEKAAFKEAKDEWKKLQSSSLQKSYESMAPCLEYKPIGGASIQNCATCLLCLGDACPNFVFI